jgi:hypothetical protein
MSGEPRSKKFDPLSPNSKESFVLKSLFFLQQQLVTFVCVCACLLSVCRWSQHGFLEQDRAASRGHSWECLESL